MAQTSFERRQLARRDKRRVDDEARMEGEGMVNGRKLRFSCMLMWNPITRQSFRYWHIFAADQPTVLLASTGSAQRAQGMVIGRIALQSDDLWKKQL